MIQTKMQACRTCMSRYSLSPLFGELSVVKFSTQQLLLATGVKIAPNDGLPQSACISCIKQIAKALDLQEMSSKVDQMLRNIMSKYNTVIKTEHDDQDMFQDKPNNAVTNNDDQDSYNKDNIPLASYKKLIDAKPVLDSDNDVKFNINKVSAEDIKDSINHLDSYAKVSSDIDSFDSYANDSVPLEESNDSKPLVENGEDNINSNNVRSKKSAKALDICSHNFTKHIANKKTKLERKHEIRSLKIHSNKQFKTEDLSETDKVTRNKGDIRIEDYISKDAAKELFGDRQYFGRDGVMSSQLSDRPNINSMMDIKGEMDKTKDIDGYVDLNFYKDIDILKREKEERDGSRELKMIIDRRKQELQEKHMKLMNLAMKPYPRYGPFRCKLCHSSLRNVNSFKTHAKTHFEPEFTCESCGKKFTSNNHMRYHQQRMHGKEKRLSCTRCSFKAVDRPTLRNHERAAHTGERPYVCDECGAAFRMRTNIIQHMKSHFGARDMQCELCPSAFTRRSQLWGHQMRVHFMTYTYHCYLCPETYKGLKPVKRHLLNVHEVPIDQQMKIKCVKTKKVATTNASTQPVEGKNSNLCQS